MDQRIFPAVEPPFLFPARRIDRVEITVPASDKQDAVGIGRRGMDYVAGFEVPFQIARCRVERIQVAVAAAEEDCAVRYDRTRKKNVELIGNRLVLGLKAVNSFRFEAALPFRRKLPFDRARLRVERVELSIV